MTRLLVSQGHHVTALVHRSPVPSFPGPGTIRTIVGDLCGEALVDDAVADADVVCHLAAFLPPDYADPAYAQACFETNAMAVLRLATCCAGAGKRLVHCSSGQAYAWSGDAITEDAALYPAERATFYLASKLTGELFVEHLRRRHGLASIVFRVGSCYGPGMERGSVVGFFMAQASAGKPLPVHDGGTAECDFVHVDDVARLIEAAVRGGEPGVYNAGSGMAHSVLDLARAVRATFPDFAVTIEAQPFAGEPQRSFPALSMAKTQAMWGHVPTSLVDGLAMLRARSEEPVPCA
ncbi:UDP-glucose 4-epimerase [Aureimonas phyllosphaerae]|uniref:UDP-glucose 4-epimerase n=1 Tax=Aureimonas phyllosphaerae TaxID=1166078 RepID=A0A7W6BZD2_9HYPH|nr:UDP-glucose 4-epimerase [Aureimonas phyllosphaerae]MBB3961660.1 UDP-glucose 4-epimerase [Aureimonas phyllosphaerae]